MCRDWWLTRAARVVRSQATLLDETAMGGEADPSWLAMEKPGRLRTGLAGLTHGPRFLASGLAHVLGLLVALHKPRTLLSGGQRGHLWSELGTEMTPHVSNFIYQPQVLRLPPRPRSPCTAHRPCPTAKASVPGRAAVLVKALSSDITRLAQVTHNPHSAPPLQAPAPLKYQA